MQRPVQGVKIQALSEALGRGLRGGALAGASLAGIGDLDFSKLAPYVDVTARILTDPYLDEVMTLARKAASFSSGPSDPNQVGIGLKKAIFPLKAYIFVREHPWFPYVAVPGAVLLPFVIGVLVGRKIAK